MSDNEGLVALHHSAESNSYTLLKYFVDEGTDIYLTTNSGMNCLHIAANFGNLKLCKILIDKHKFDVQMTDKNGWTALHHSARNGDKNLVKYFVDRGANIKLETKNGCNRLHIAAQYEHWCLCKMLILNITLMCIWLTDTAGQHYFIQQEMVGMVL